MKTTTPARVIMCFLVSLALFMITFGVIGLTGSKVVMRENDDVALRSLRNECAIVATTAYERLRATGAWVQILDVSIEFTDGRVVVTRWSCGKSGRAHGSASMIRHLSMALPRWRCANDR